MVMITFFFDFVKNQKINAAAARFISINLSFAPF